MRKRSANLLLHFLQRNKPLPIDNIMTLNQISLRTLRSDLSEINDFLSSINQPTFYINDTGNIQNRATINIQSTKDALFAINNYSYRCSQIERQSLILAILLNQYDDYITMEFLAEKLFVSRITVLSDIELIKETLENYPDIDLLSKSSKGIKLDINSELQLRYLLIDILRNSIIKIDEENLFLHLLEKVLDAPYPIACVIAAVRKYENSTNILFSDESYYEIVLYLFVAIYRYSKNHSLSSSNKNPPVNAIKQNNALGDIIAHILVSLNITMSKQQQLLIVDSFEYNQISIAAQKVQDIELYKIVVYFLSALTRENTASQFNVKLEEDHLLVDSLVIHIKNMFDDVALDLDFSCEEGFQEPYWDILDDIDKNIVIIERYLMRTLSERMKLSIFVHVCAALIRNKKYYSSLSVLVVCPGSMATGRFIEAQLNNYFNFKIVGVVSIDRVLNTIRDRGDPIDFIVSTVDVVTDFCPVIIVEPILTNNNINKIQYLATQMSYKNREQKEQEGNLNDSILKPIMDIFDKLDKNHQNNFLADIEKVTSQYSEAIKQKANTNIVQMLGSNSNIQIIDRPIDWFEAITRSGNILLAQNCINKNYIDEMINNIHQYGPYIKVGKKIAIAHAKPEQHVYSEGLSLLLAKRGIYFGDKLDEKNENTINLMFCFSTMGNLEYIDLFWQITHLGNDDAFIDLLLNAKTTDEVYELISNRVIN